MFDAMKIYNQEKNEAREKGKEYSKFQVELKLIRSDLNATNEHGQTSSVSVA